MRVMIAVLACLAAAVGHGQTTLAKIGPGGSSIVHVTCQDAMRGISPSEQVELGRDFKSDIVLRRVAEADKGSGRLSSNDFTYRNRYATDESLDDFRNTDFKGRLGSVSGNVTREFLIGFHDTARPLVIILHLGDDSGQFVFTSNP